MSNYHHHRKSHNHNSNMDSKSETKPDTIASVSKIESKIISKTDPGVASLQKKDIPGSTRKAPAHINYPMHPRASSMVAHPATPPFPQIKEHNEHQIPLTRKADSQNINIPIDKPNEANPAEPNSPMKVSDEQWWLKYDEYLGELFK